MDLHVGDFSQLLWLWLLAGCIALVTVAAVARRRARARYATANLIGRMLPPSNRFRRAVSATLITAAMLLLVLALMDIRWGKVWRDVPQQGIEVMFILDVSRSMLAEDLSPNRLERAKQQIKDIVDEMAGDRVGLVVFAGEARQQIPLTTDYDDFKQLLDEVGPHNVRRGGSQLGVAIDTAAHAFLTKSNAHKAMVIFTDGEDQDSDPIAIAKKVYAENGVRIFTVGLGDTNTGSRIPIHSQTSTDYLRHDGEQVWSKMHGEILRKVAIETNGAFIPAGTKQVNMSDVYHGYIANVKQTQFETARINQYEARFQWFLGVALLLMLAEIATVTWPARSAMRIESAANALRGKAQLMKVSRKASIIDHSTAA